MNRPSTFDAFISFKSEDEKHARVVFDTLDANGLRVFFSRTSLPALGSDEYHAQIDLAIDQARHMFVVTSSKKNVEAKWVQYEWRLFLGEHLAGRKTGNLITIITGDMSVDELPISLRNREVISLTSDGLSRLIEYTRADIDRAVASPAAKETPALAALADLLSGDHDKVQSAIGRIEARERPTYIAELKKAVSSQSPVERRSSLEALSLLGIPDLAVYLIQAGNDADASVRRQAMFLIGSARITKAREIVSFRMSDNNPDVRAAAREAFRKLTGGRS